MRGIGGRDELRGELASGGWRLSIGPDDLQYGGGMEVVAQSLPAGVEESAEVIAWIRELTTHWMRTSHPNRLQLYGLERSGERWVLLTEPEPAYSLASMAAAAARVPLEERIGWAVARLLELEGAVTSYGEVHGEIGGRSVAFTGESRLVLLPPLPRASTDHAVTGRATYSGSRTLRWMTPEEVRGQTRTHASDVHQLGLVAGALLGAPSPYEALTDFETITAKTSGAPVPRPRELGLDVPPALDAALGRATALAPADRFATAAELAVELRPFARDSAAVRERVRAILEELRPPRRKLPFLEGLVHRPCSKRWDELTPTARDEVRHCSDCDLTVQRVRTVAALVPLEGSCVFYDPEREPD